MAAVLSTSFLSQCGENRSSQVAVIGSVFTRFVYLLGLSYPSPRAATRVGESGRVGLCVYKVAIRFFANEIALSFLLPCMMKSTVPGCCE